MSLAETAKMVWVVGRGGWRLFRDYLGDRAGTALVYKADDVATPQVLSYLLRSGALQPGSEAVTIRSVVREDIPSVSSNCHNLVLSIEQSGTPTLPATLFVKLPMESLLTRWFFSVINSWQLESYFFRHVAQHIPLRTPVTYATRCQGTRFYLIQENLHEDPGVQLFTNPDMLVGPSMDIVHRCLDAFARLHACHYGISAQEREAILPLEYHLFLSAGMGVVARNLNRLALSPCMKKQPDAIPAEVAVTYRLTMQHWDALLAYWFDGPLSLLHGDSHLGNFFVSDEQMGMLDWQAAHWGKGIRDVQYFLINSLPADTLAAHEHELVQYYVARRGHYGLAIDPAQTWEEYRSFTFHTLMTMVVSVGFGALNKEQDVLMAEGLRRAVAAVQRVRYGEWLRAYLAGRND
jgi:hypothetical protein